MPIRTLVSADCFNFDGVEGWASLRVAPRTPEIIEILRLLSGTVEVVDERTSQVLYRSGVNWINAEDVFDRDTYQGVMRYVFDEIPDEQQVEQMVSGLRSKNRGFFKEIAGDFRFLFVSMEEGRFTDAFLLIYRIVERMSVACPLLYASRDTEFHKAHQFLCSLFEDSTTAPGELGMLRSFLHKHAETDEDFSLANLSFDFSGIDPDLWAVVISTFIEIRESIASLQINEMSYGISIPYKDVSSLIVLIRNKTFHNLGSRKNINIAKFGGADVLFELLVKDITRWLSYVFVDIARWQFQVSGIPQ